MFEFTLWHVVHAQCYSHKKLPKEEDPTTSWSCFDTSHGGRCQNNFKKLSISDPVCRFYQFLCQTGRNDGLGRMRRLILRRRPKITFSTTCPKATMAYLNCDFGTPGIPRRHPWCLCSRLRSNRPRCHRKAPSWFPWATITSANWQSHSYLNQLLAIVLQFDIQDLLPITQCFVPTEQIFLQERQQLHLWDFYRLWIIIVGL
jgi:hypothetical protein